MSELESFFLTLAQDEMIMGMEVNPYELKTLLQKGERATLDENIPGAFHRCLAFTDEFSMPFEDLFMIDSQNWELAGTSARCFPFPIAFRKDMGEHLFRPPLPDFEWFEVACYTYLELQRDVNNNKIKLQNAEGIDYTVTLFNRHENVKATWYIKSDDNFSTLDPVWEKVAVPDKVPLQEPSKEVKFSTDDSACKVCGKKEVTLKRCGKCKEKLYCSRECQVANWPDHSKTCSSPKS